MVLSHWARAGTGNIRISTLPLLPPVQFVHKKSASTSCVLNALVLAVVWLNVYDEAMNDQSVVAGDRSEASPLAAKLSVLAKGIDRLEAIARGEAIEAV